MSLLTTRKNVILRGMGDLGAEGVAENESQ